MKITNCAECAAYGLEHCKCGVTDKQAPASAVPPREWDKECDGRHYWMTSGGSAPRSFCYVCKRCGWWGWFEHLFDCNEIRTRINFWRFPFLARFGFWRKGPEAPLPGMNPENYR